MRADHYQELMDRGWRRSGKLYYKPDLSRSCCPPYTIRLMSSEFKATREQRKAIHRFNRHVLGAEYKRKAAMLCPVPRELKRQKRDTFDLPEAIHLSEYPNVQRPGSRKSGAPIEPAHKFEVNLEADSFSREKYDVFFRYQRQIHKDPASRWPESAFKRFLCGGLDRSLVEIGGKTKKQGSHHQCYRLNGKLVAVGILDLLPHAVSSVYMMYDPDYAHFDWGKITALREITLATEGGYGYYYMGYYIHSCIKMRYKGEFKPSYLLDPESLDWNIFDEAYRQKLDAQRYVSPSKELRALPVEPSGALEAATDLPPAEAKNDDTTKSRAATFADDQDLELDEEDSENEDAEIPPGTMFQYNIPGVLTKDQVADLDLGKWKLIIRNTLVDFEASLQNRHDLRDWGQWQLDDPGSIKGIAAELVAATGPRLLQHSALSLF
ncbi:uncharacterized protein HMPREF1541_02359 [Cyphellophora europaea CBS 101466]|uniref:arginyltransferase n=1 Tax=Cyphellophora europaea (strain CBS 101466) TaxID=1220924 RepID=W2S3L8_CYPE1|nr:uncharacterized protein HMPREF1541_02359 [Cyphellophora europaea CBS 101466]ETN43200.1 hypothetical protein HMPREF1541_02359 [Cyphellophora europaea CBS 101466]